MTFTEASQILKIPVKLIRELHDRSIVSSPLTPAEVGHLRFFAKFWRAERVLKIQLAQFATRQRLKLINTAGLNKVESYIYNRYLNLKMGKRISTRQVALELYKHYGVPMDSKIMERIISIRGRAYKAREANRRKSERKKKE